MSVDSIARKHNGIKTWGFSQSDFMVWVHYRTMGICAALSAHWIKYHAQEDSLPAHLKGDKALGPLNVSLLKQIAQDHKQLTELSGGQADNIELWLQMHGVKTINRSLMVRKYARGGDIMVPGSRAHEQSAMGNCPNIENDIVNAMRRFNTCYVRINFGKTAGLGHAVAAWLGQPTYGGSGDALFFDPNYGEYWFEQKRDFFTFFPEFYRSAYKGFPTYFAGRWDVLPCALAVNGR